MNRLEVCQIPGVRLLEPMPLFALVQIEEDCIATAGDNRTRSMLYREAREPKAERPVRVLSREGFEGRWIQQYGHAESAGQPLDACRVPTDANHAIASGELNQHW